MFEIKDISKSYNGKNVLNSVSFTLSEGEWLGISGENGAGKSTLLKILAGVEKPDSGSVLLNGKNLAHRRGLRRKSIGYAPQRNSLDESLTVKKQIALWQAALGCKKDNLSQISDVLGLTDLMDCQVGKLSGGQAQRVSVALALLANPGILLMDEATVGLDNIYGPKLIDYLKEFTANGGSIIWCSHAETEMADVCSRIMTFTNGKLQ